VKNDSGAALLHRAVSGAFFHLRLCTQTDLCALEQGFENQGHQTAVQGRAY
jgi:hypothetical protein